MLKRIFSLLIVFIILISCNFTPVNQINQQTKTYYVPLKTEYGTIILNISFPYKFSDDYLKKLYFNTKALQVNRINKIKISVSGVVSGTEEEYKDEETLPLQVGGVQAKLIIPFGKNYVVTVQGLNNTEIINGATIKGVFSIDKTTSIPPVYVNPNTTPVATIIEKLRIKDKEKEDKDKIADKVDIQELKNWVEKARGVFHPSLINTDAFTEAITIKDGIVSIPKEIPEKAILKAGTIKGSIKGLTPGSTAILTCSDPASQPFIVVVPPIAVASGSSSSSSSEKDSITFTIDNVTPGDWVLYPSTSGFQLVLEEGSSSTEETTSVEYIPIKVSEGEITEGGDFTVSQLEWATDIKNVSGNHGASDQPSVTIDGIDNFHLVWRQDGDIDPTSGFILYSRWNGSTWSTSWSTEKFTISPKGNENFKGARHPDITVANDRTPHVVWSSINEKGYRHILYNYFNGFKWLEIPIKISNYNGDETGNLMADFPDITLNKVNNRLYVVWEQKEKLDGKTCIYFSEYDGKKWLDKPIKVSGNGENDYGTIPKIAVGTDNIIHIIWKDLLNFSIKYVNYDYKTSKFSSIETIPFSTLGEDNNNFLDIGVDAVNRVHIIWSKRDYIQYIRRSNDSWSRPDEVVNNIPGIIDLPVISGASLFIDSIGNVNVIWESKEQDGTTKIFYRRRTNEGWEKPSSEEVTSSPSPTTFPIPSSSASASSTPSVSSSGATPYPGYDKVVGSENKTTNYKPFLLITRFGVVNIIWSNDAVSPRDSEIYHVIKKQGKESSS